MRNDGEGCAAAFITILMICFFSFMGYWGFKSMEDNFTVEKATIIDKVYNDDYEKFYIVVKHNDQFHIFTVKKSVFDVSEPKGEIDVEQPISRSGVKLTPRLVKSGGT